jgi:hypothetical protein
VTKFDPADAAFFGFRLVTRDPLLLAALAALNALYTVFAMLIVLPAMGPVMALAEADMSGAAVAPQEVLDAYAALLAETWWVSALGLVVAVAIQGALLRAMIFERRGGWAFGLALGADELRLAVVNTLVHLFLFIVFLAAVVVFEVIAGLAGAAVLAFLAVLAAAAATSYFGVRLSASAATSVGERRLLVVAGWRISRGHVWGLLGAHVLLVFIGVVAWLAAFVLSTVAAAAGGVNLLDPAGGSVDPERLAALARNGGYIAAMVIQSVIGLALTAAWVGIGAYAYRTLGPEAGYGGAPPPELERGHA